MIARSVGYSTETYSRALQEPECCSTYFRPGLTLRRSWLRASVLAVTPGPGVVYIVSRSVADGRRHGLASVLGVAFGNLGNAWAASAGLAAMFAISTTAFSVVKYSGASYLVYLGFRTLRNSRVTAQPMDVVPAQPLGRVVRDGFLVALLNPKTALFFAACLPQFLAPGAASLLQTAVLGGDLCGGCRGNGSVSAVFADAVAPELARRRVVDLWVLCRRNHVRGTGALYRTDTVPQCQIACDRAHPQVEQQLVVLQRRVLFHTRAVSQVAPDGGWQRPNYLRREDLLPCGSALRRRCSPVIVIS